MMRIEIGRRNYLLYLVLPHPLKVALLSPASRGKLDRINRGFNAVRISGFWIPYSRRLIPDARRRFQWERVIGRLPGQRHWAAVLAVEARRTRR